MRRARTESRYRPQFDEWSCELEIAYDPTAITSGELIALLALAGERVGIGEWRAEKGAPFGRFRVVEVIDG